MTKYNFTPQQRRQMIYEIVLCAMLTGMLAVIGLLTSLFIKFNGSTLQFATGAFIGLCAVKRSWYIYLAGILYVCIIDGLGFPIYITISIIVNTLIFITCWGFSKLKYKDFNLILVGIIISSFYVMLYIAYGAAIGLLNTSGAVVTELIIDVVQASASLVLGIALYYGLRNKIDKITSFGPNQ